MQQQRISANWSSVNAERAAVELAGLLHEELNFAHSLSLLQTVIYVHQSNGAI